jgi:hypothetical protein
VGTKSREDSPSQRLCLPRGVDAPRPGPVSSAPSIHPAHTIMPDPRLPPKPRRWPGSACWT